MIGLNHEPSRAILDALNEALGEGNYSIAYHDGPSGVSGIIRMREQPQREFKTHFARDAAPEQVEAVWQELIARTTATLKSELEQEQAAARAYRPDPSPANEVKPGEAEPPVRITAQTEVTESESDLVEREGSSDDRNDAPDNEPGVDHAHVEGGTGTGEGATGGGEHFESSTADEGRRR